MKLSVIIVNWNTQKLLEQCLHSILSATQPEILTRIEVFVVDNASSDGSADMVRQHFPWVRLIQSPENLGFARANNLAIHQSTGRYLLLLNPDTEVQTGAFEVLLEFMDTHSEVGAAGSRLLNVDGTLQFSCIPAPTLTRELWRLLHLDLVYPYGSYRMQKWSIQRPRKVDTVQGACMIVRKEVLLQVGVLDEDYFMYTEEVDLCYRIKGAGWQIYWVPAAAVIHYGGQSTQQVAVEMFLELYRSKVMYIRKHYGWLAARSYKFVLMLTAMIRVLVAPLALLERPLKRKRHLTLANNYRRLMLALSSM